MAKPSSFPFAPLNNSPDRLVVAIEDVNDLWSILKEPFEARVPFRKATLNNKARNPVTAEQLPVEYILTTDARLRTRIPTDQLPLPLWYRSPYATVVLITCDDLDEYKNVLKPRLKALVQNEDREWFIVFVLKSVADSTNKLVRRVYSKLENEFSSKRRERCCKLELHGGETAVWDDLESKIVECIRITLDRRVLYYEEEVRKLSETRFLPTWNFGNFFIVKERLAFMFEMAQLQEDALREYDELEQIYLEIVNAPNVKAKEFGGTDIGDDRAALLEGLRKPFSQFVHDGVVREFDFRQYLFSRQAQLLFSLNRPAEVAARGNTFIMTFSRTLVPHEKKLPFCLREVWVITACLTLVKATAQRFTWRTAPDMEKDFYRLQADLYFYARTKFMRLADLIGYGKIIERSPCNSAALSMLPWPKPAVWPAVPSDAAARILAKEQFQAAQQNNLEGIALKNQLSLSPSVLLREANRRRASLSAGNLSEMVDTNRLSFSETSPAVDGGAPASLSPSTSKESLENTQPRPLETARSNIDPPMNLLEIHVAAEHALLNSITDETLRKSLTSVENFEEFYLDLTRKSADNFHRSSRKRHGVILDGEVAAVHYHRGALDAAAKLYEKVCALYASERWNALLAEVLPRLINCQRQLRDWSAYLFSCVKLLSVDSFLLSTEDRRYLQSEIVKLAHNGLKVPVFLDVSALITFAARGGPPLELCESDPGVLEVVVWSGFVEDVCMESLSLTLIATFTADEGAKVVKSLQTPVLKPGKNRVLIDIPPQRPGSYVLGALTGHLGQVRLRSHTYCSTSAASSKGGPPGSDDVLSYEKPLRPVLEVLQPRALVEIKAAVATGLLVREPQWVGIVIQPLNYSLKRAVVYISVGPGLCLESPQTAQLELYSSAFPHESGEKSEIDDNKGTMDFPSTPPPEGFEPLEIKNGTVVLSDWASTVASVLWVQVMATPDPEEKMPSTGIQIFPAPHPPASPKALPPRTTSSKASQLGFNHTLSINGSIQESRAPSFTCPFRTLVRTVSQGNDGTLFLQVTLKSQVEAIVTIVDAKLALQPGFSHVDDPEGRPSPSLLLPLSLSATREGALLFVVRSDLAARKEGNMLFPKSTLNVQYKISGDRRHGAHSHQGSHLLEYSSSFVLEMPVLEQLVAVGMLAILSKNLRVGQQIIFQWRVERLKEGRATLCFQREAGDAHGSDSTSKDEDAEELSYELKINEKSWMIAGRKKGSISLSQQLGARTVISMACVPLVTGHVHPPALHLANVSRPNISHSPAGPHLVCILPPDPCSALCVKKGI
ncbi:unnamed protein product [Sphagnum troendelagicum]|uniref:Trafficking protein particle complex subunit 10 n=1 Tax=Sphagnum troendelagicum TaxID=128251 RepID=A0ABP0TW04_9BRYO